MTIDTLGKNVAGYIGWAVLAVIVGVLQDLHRQLDGDQSISAWEILDAAIVNILPILIVMLGAMKQPSVGHEEIADKAATHEDRLVVEDTPKPKPKRVRKAKATAGATTAAQVGGDGRG